MFKKFIIPGILLYLTLLGASVSQEAAVKTENLIIRDVTGNLSPAKLELFAKKVDSTFEAVHKFWSADTRINEFGKIIVELDRPLPKADSSFLFWRKEEGRKVRVVKVFGGDENPLLLAHKLTSALFPNPDKLIRNMMGEVAEKRFGNPLSFPMCGFDKDQWVMALQNEGLYISLSNIGSKHEDWGMEIINNVPVVRDRPKQHASYLEAGSFGEFLISTYGIDKMKQFNKISINVTRPWHEVYGLTLKQLEEKWLETLKLKSKGKESQISTLSILLRSNPVTACHSAQNLTEKK
ncbi:MAG: hypothetical protein A2031_05665 [Deltaproteobacteria bacterium RBG_19FT_COMBO_43_11]|nr:MAG: hypothetical protein A2031_05665 [Deltaproteobacteria bacterium RBG_19FT_COMBO_43_11]